MSTQENSIESAFLFMEDPKSKMSIFGIFIGIFVLFIINLFVNIRKGFLILVDILIIFLFYELFSRLADEPYEYGQHLNESLFILDFVFPIFEQIIYSHVIMYISRSLIFRSGSKNRGKTRSQASYLIITVVFSFIPLTLTFFLLGQAITQNKSNWEQTLSFCLLIFAFILTLSCDNGHLFDVVMIGFKTALSLTPSYGAILPTFTQISRFLLFSISLFIANFTKSEPGTLSSGFAHLNPNGHSNTIFFTLLIIAYAFLSPNYLITPSQDCHLFNSIVCPLVYLFI